jgi:hypothetical protein
MQKQIIDRVEFYLASDVEKLMADHAQEMQEKDDETIKVYHSDCHGVLHDHNGRIGTSDESGVVYAVRILNRQHEQIASLTAQLAAQGEYIDSLTTAKIEAEDMWAKLERQLAEARKEIELLIDFIPDGWSMPLGYAQVVVQAKEALTDKETG